MNKTQQPYYLGLELNDDAIGWAVTDRSYNILRISGKDAWGVRLFAPAETAEDARAIRVGRRASRRKKRNIQFLQKMFAEELDKVDPLFLTRLEESKLYKEDRSEANKQINGIFWDPEYDDKAYFKEYPTIYHLKQELICSKEPHDVRLVYLAMLHYFKHRGHFYAKSVSGENGIVDIPKAYKELQEQAAFFDIVLTDVDLDTLVQTLCNDKMSPSRIEKELEEILQSLPKSFAN